MPSKTSELSSGLKDDRGFPLLMSVSFRLSELPPLDDLFSGAPKSNASPLFTASGSLYAAALIDAAVIVFASSRALESA